VFRDERFWGQDRISWLVRSIARANGLEVPAPELSNP
jgi:hypothetical protein